MPRFEKKSRRNKGKRTGVQYVVTSSTRHSQPQTEKLNGLEAISEGSFLDGAELFQRAAETERNNTQREFYLSQSKASLTKTYGAQSSQSSMDGSRDYERELKKM